MCTCTTGTCMRMIHDLFSYSRDMQSYHEEFLWHKIFVNFMSKQKKFLNKIHVHVC